MPAISQKLTALGITAAIAAGGAAVPSTGFADATAPGKHVVTAKSTYTFHNGPAKGFDGTLLEGDTVKVKRISKSGQWAYGMAYGHVNRHVWVKASVLAKR